MVGETPHGIARYASALWEGLPARQDLAYAALCRPGAKVARRRPTDRLILSRSPFLSPLEQLELPWLLRRAGVDLLHATSFAVPAAWRGPLVLTLHDMNHLALPGWAGPGRKPYYDALVLPAARRASQILTVSAFAGREIARWTGVPEGRIAVAPDAIGDAYRPPSPEAAAAVRQRFQLPGRYLLCLASGRSHKNVGLLIEALAGRPGPPLVLCGHGFESFAAHSPRLRLLPEVADADLPALYGGAALFLFPSVHEGFGLPPLEAAASGAPLLVARGSALDEIWDGVALQLPPHRPARWAEAIAELLADEPRRLALAARCAARAERYRSWAEAIAAAERAYQAALRFV